ncbi:MAG: bifunctional UDP-sugar hydrolase/5'-nucleotidase [Kofleriaceae bacterium]
MRLVAVIASLCVAAACSGPTKREDGPRTPPKRRTGAVTLTIIGTNDLHGAIDRLPLFAGYMENLRSAREADGGGVVLVDAGDMFQGTLESNLEEGKHIVRAYNEIGYAAAAVGNHEFDFGPEGPAATADSIEDDPRGALKARAKEAKFPFLVANIADDKSGERIKWPNMPASTLVEVAGVKIGIVGASTEATPFTTMPANFVGLKMRSPATEIAAEAKTLRAKGATLILVTAHIGTKCEKYDVPMDISSCKKDEELIKMIDELPKGTVDVIVAGHTHAVVAHRINDIAVIESFSSGRAFGRVDLRIAPDGHVSNVKIHQPRMLCEGEKDGNAMPAAQCNPGDYEGKPVVADAAVQAIADEAAAAAAPKRHEKLGVMLTGVVAKSYGTESAEGNWFTDLMLATQPAHVALTNGGGLRADLPAGELTYGALYEAIPFDNRFAHVDLKGTHLRRLISTNLQRGGAILSWGGLAAKARCKAGKLELDIKVGGKPLDDNASYKLVTSDFLASGGDGLIGRLKLPEGSVVVTNDIIRDVLAEHLRKQKGAKVDPAKLYGPNVKRMDYEGSRPVECGDKTKTKPPEEQPE